ncbi:VirK/YbjX family protein [Sodalis sp. RH21]|uniref:VirK/YbjX family protein n=1 Tax=unclassified Sodalis (in: enterobacteria) TaxID=2636512 RepID=UPI0039B4A383
MSQLVSSLEKPRLLTGWQLALALFRGKLVPGMAWRHRFYRGKFLFRHLWTAAYSVPWLRYLACCPILPEILQSQPGLPCKLHRPYLASNMNHKQQLAALVYHYDYIQQHLPRPLLNGHLTRSGIVLATLEGKNGQQFYLRLGSLDNLNREGEATVLITDERGVMLAEMTFVITPEQGTTLFIGGLQGAQRQVPHEAIHLATKSCHGLFPKRLVLEAVTLLATNLGARQILAVGNRTHMYQEWRYFYKKKGFLHADYDNFWLSMQAQPHGEGYFRLPLAITRKGLETLPSKKRAEYRRRYELLDRLAAQINAFFPHTTGAGGTSRA